MTIFGEEAREYGREAARRCRARKTYVKAGLPIPPEFEKRKTGPSAQRPEELKLRAKEQIAERTVRNRKIVNDIKSITPCVDCSMVFAPICMDFDHREGEEKIYGYRGGVSTLVGNGGAVEKLLAEIAKCDLVCANCHRIRTATKAGWDESLLTSPSVE